MTDSRPTALIIDDSPEDTQKVRRWLRDSFDVITADRGERGLALAATHRPDVLLLDDVLPDMTGLEFFDARGPGHDEDYAVIILTGHADTALAVECMKHGAHDFLTKGRFDADDLRRAVANGIEKVAMRRQVRAQQRQLEQSLALVEELNRTMERRVAQLTALTQELDDLYEHAPCGYHSLAPDGTFLRINATELEWLGYRREEVIGRMKLTDFFTRTGRILFQQSFTRLMRDGHSEDLEFDLIARDGSIRRVSLRATAVTDARGRYVRSRSVLYDITELKKTHDRLRHLTHQQQAMLDNELVGIAILHDRRILWSNKALARLFGYEPGELDGQASRILYPDDADYQAARDIVYPILDARGIFRTQAQVMRKDGERIWVDASATLLDGEDQEYLWMLVDITATKRHQEAVEQLAYHDSLTGLPNRLLISDRLNQSLAEAQRSHRLLAVCYLDLDDFKPVNDTFGHAAGDHLLKAIGNRLRSVLRAHDSVGRLGGDEFVLLLTQLSGLADCRGLLQRVINAIKQPVLLDEATAVSVTASIGVSLYPADPGDADTLLRHADQAMYQAKNAGRNQVCIFPPEV